MGLSDLKNNYPGKWKDAQRMAQEIYMLTPGTLEYSEKAESLFVELGGGCVENYKPAIIPNNDEMILYINSLEWSQDRSEEVRSLVACNLNGFVSWLKHREREIKK